jgi:N-acetylglucosaminyldiphosphoundecaprenol N-acetyl-beta-D-mannosaminyltransferase
MNLTQAVEIIDRWVSTRRREYVCVTGAHGVIESQRDESLRDIHNAAGLVTPDGMPLVWLLKLAGYRQCSRVYGPDLMLAVFDHGQRRGYRHFLYGASERALERLRVRLTVWFPGAQIVGRISPPFRSVSKEENRSIINSINNSAADIVWVGLSTPKQELWMAEHRRSLSAPVLIGVGAAFDLHAGLVPQAPRVLQRSGLEWAFRLCVEPRRLWRRYLKNNPRFLIEIIAQKAQLRRYPDLP